jgi:6,7-dimethyl-8-ribityllumazine synthase
VSEPYDSPRWNVDEEEQEEESAERPRDALRPPGAGPFDHALRGSAEVDDAEDLERASENVLEGWPEPVEEPFSAEDVHLSDPTVAHHASPPEPEATAAVPAHEAPDAADEQEEQEEQDEPDEPDELDEPSAEDAATTSEHAPGELVVPPGVPLLEGSPNGERRAVGIVVSRFNGDVTSRLLESALEELETLGVARDAVTVMPVPGAFELPLAAMALAKTRRFACIVALGCVIRGDTPHFDYICAEAASGIQLAGIETGVPVAFGVLTLDRAHQAEARFDKGAEAVRTALEMADLFANLRAAAAR